MHVNTARMRGTRPPVQSHWMAAGGSSKGYREQLLSLIILTDIDETLAPLILSS